MTLMEMRGERWKGCFHLYLARFLWSPCGMSANIVCAVWVGGDDIDDDDDDDDFGDDNDDDDDDDLIDVMDDPAQVGLEVRGGERLKVC